MRVVLDTNVIIAAFATHGLCHLVFETVLAHHKIVLSPGLLAEIRRTLKAKVKLPEKRVNEICEFLKHHSIYLKDKPATNIACRDPDDLKVLALAVLGEADAIITGDHDLLVLNGNLTTSILSPREFWTLLRASRP